MFVILTYDVEVDRIDKVRKTLKKYLTWTQNSVFEGEITKGKLNKCLGEIKGIIDKDNDSIYIYNVVSEKYMSKDVIGKEKSGNQLFL